MLGRATSFSIEIEHFALVTHRVPAARVRRVLPERYQLQIHLNDAVEYCFVTSTCFCNRQFRPTATQYPRHTFNEVTYRTYVTHKGRAGVYFFGRYLGSGAALVAQRAIARDTFHADFDVRVERGPSGYSSYVCKATDERGETAFALEASDPPPAIPPWRTGREHEQFLTFRPHGYFTSALGFQGHCPVEHEPLDAWSGTLHAGRFDLWAELGVVPEEEAGSPYSVLVTPGTRFVLHAPRPLV